jgi:hypothetical protein
MGFESAVQTAIASRLDSYISCPVYDAPPKSAAYPYAVLGEDTIIEDGTCTTIGRMCLSTIHVFDNYSGKKRIKTILGEIDARLDRAVLTAAGHHFIDCSFDTSDCFLEPDGKTYHGVITYKILIDRED